MKKITGLFIIMSFIHTACSIAPPKIHLTGERTVVENQIVGEYRELEKDAWVISSPKTNVQKNDSSGGSIASDQKLYEAMKLREYHEKKIRTFKDEGALGEGFRGRLHYRPARKYEKDKDMKRNLMEVIENENNARETVFARSLETKDGKEVTKQAIDDFGQRFAQEQRSLAKKNDWIQDETGRWSRK